MAAYTKEPTTKRVKLDDDSSEPRRCWITTDESGNDSDTDEDSGFTMTEKRSISNLSPSRFSSTKHQKKTNWSDCNWSDDNINYKKSYHSGYGVKDVQTFQSRAESDRSFEEIKHQIQCTDNLQIRQSIFLYYTGFKNGLNYLLTEIPELHDKYKAIIIHGIPKVGKTSLARNLAYHLASNDSTATLVTMDNTQDIYDSETVTETLGDFCDEPGWVIIDQINVHRIDKNKLQDQLLNISKSKRRNPWIMFTLGDYAPPDETWNDGEFLLKVIDMRIDEAAIDLLKEQKNKNINTAELLQVTHVFGQAYDIIGSLRKDSTLNLDDLRTRVYEQVEFQDFLSRNLNILWILWPKFCNESTQTICENNKPEDWKIPPSLVEILRYALNDIDNQNQKLYANWLYIDGDGRSNHNKDEGFYVHTEYFYYFPCVEKLLEGFRKANKKSPELRLEDMKSDYRLHIKAYFDRSARAVAGHFFEGIIRMQCQLRSKKGPYGIAHNGAVGVDFISVHDVIQPCSVDDLCQILEDKRTASRETQLFWCDLNAVNKEFPGYDFALVQVQEGKYALFQLFRVTIKPDCHPIETMVKVLNDIEEKLYKPDTSTGKVVPYFLCPYDSGRKRKESRTVGNQSVQIIEMNYF